MEQPVMQSADGFTCEWCGPGRSIQAAYYVPVALVLRSVTPIGGQINGEVCVFDEEVREEFEEHAAMVEQGVRCGSCFRPVPRDVAERVLACVREYDWPAWQFGT